MSPWDDKDRWDMLTPDGPFKLKEDGWQVVVPDPPRPEPQADGDSGQ